MSDQLPSRHLTLEAARANLRGIPDLFEFKGMLLKLLQGDPNDEAVAEAMELATRSLRVMTQQIILQAKQKGEADALVRKMASFHVRD